MRQGSALSPILYIIPIFHIFKKRTNSLLSSIFVSTLSFVDNGLFISQKKSYEKLNTNLFFSYSIIYFLFEQFGLIIKHNKSKVFYFSRMMKNYKLPSLNLRPLRGYLLWSKDNWRYLEFFFDRKLTFHQHIHFYTNKALFTIKNMKMLGNSTRELLSIHKQLLYKTCIILITLYGFQLWYYKRVPLFYPLK